MADLIDNLGFAKLRWPAVGRKDAGLTGGAGPGFGALFGLAPFAVGFGFWRASLRGCLSAFAAQPVAHDQNNDDGDEERQNRPPLSSPAICHGREERSMRGLMPQRN